MSWWWQNTAPMWLQVFWWRFSRVAFGDGGTSTLMRLVVAWAAAWVSVEVML